MNFDKPPYKNEQADDHPPAPKKTMKERWDAFCEFIVKLWTPPEATMFPPTGSEDKTAGKSDTAALPWSGNPSHSGSPNQSGPLTDMGYPVWRPETDEPFKVHMFSPKVEMLKRTPKVLITPEAFKRMSLYVELGSKEVGWLGTAERTAGGDFLITNTFLLDQEVTPTETELSVDGINALAMQLVEQGDAGMKALNELKFWGHSHVRMGTSPSGTDERTMERFGREGHPWYIRGIFNKRGRAEFTIYLFEEGLRINDAPWAVFDPVSGQTLTTRNRVVEMRARPTPKPPVAAAPEAPAADATTANPGVKPSASPEEDARTYVDNYLKNMRKKPQGEAAPGQTPSTYPAGLQSPQNATGSAATPGAKPADTVKPAEPVVEAVVKMVLPAELTPSAELRSEVEAEFGLKVRERKFTPLVDILKLFGLSKDEDGDKPQKGEKDEGSGAADGKKKPKFLRKPDERDNKDFKKD